MSTVKMHHPEVDDEIEVLDLAVPLYEESGWKLKEPALAEGAEQASKNSGGQPSVTSGATSAAPRLGGAGSAENNKEGK